MDEIRILEIKESVFADNDREAEVLRQQLKAENTFLINLMSSPGSGKTSLLLALAKELPPNLTTFFILQISCYLLQVI